MRISNIPREEVEIKEVMERGFESILSVEFSNKLSTTWGRIKEQ